MYTSMMASKGVFLAEITYIMEMFSIDKATASMANTYYFATYAGMQLLLFFFVSRIDLRKFLAVTVPIAAVMIILMGFSQSIVDMWILFAICGLFQAGVYCGCTHTLTRYLPTAYLSKANSVMNFGYAVGTVVSYGISALCVRFGAWSIPFFITGALLLLASVIFTVSVFCAREPEEISLRASDSKAQARDDTPLFTVETRKKKIIFYSLDLIIVFFVTTLYYAVMNWISTLLVDVYSLNQDISIYITILAPALIAIGPVMTIRACDRDRDFIREGIFYMLAALPLPLLLAFFYDVNVVLAFSLSVIFVILINGVKSIGLSIITFKLRRVINAAQYTAISNALASLAGSIAPTVVGKIIDSSGWRASYFAIFAVAAAVIAVMLVVDIVLRRSIKKHDMEKLQNA